MTRVLLCDDHDDAQLMLARISECRVEDGGEEIVVSRHAQTARAGFRAVAATRVDVVLIDLFLPIGDRRGAAPPSGPWLARAITRAHPDRRPLLIMWTSNVTSTLDVRNHCRAFRHHGGAHIIDKQQPAGAQLRTFEAALSGVTWEPPPDELTATEREILAYYATGHTEKFIARSTHRSEKTIEGHVGNIRRKLLDQAPDSGAAYGRGAGPVIAAASAADSCVSWLTLEHLSEPAGVLARIDQG